MAEVIVINGEADARFSKVFRKECMRLGRPQRYDGRGDAQVLDEFVVGLRTYLHFYTESEEQRVLLASCFLEAEARQWWLYLAMGTNDRGGSTMLPRLCKPFWEGSCQGPLGSKL